MRARRLASFGVLVVVAGLLAGAATAQAVVGSSSGGEALRLAAIPRGAPSNLTGALARLAATTGGEGALPALALAQSTGLEVVGQRVRVIVVPRDGEIGGAESAVASSGGSIEAEADGLVQALVAPSALHGLAEDGSVSQVRDPDVPVPQAVDEGVSATGANVWQEAGYGGTGVKVAIIDIGFYGYQALLGGALPSSVVTDDRCGGNLAASPADGGSAHGTAVAELVHQMAPDAQLYLMCVDSEVTLAQAEQDAVADGVQIINHSVGWLNTSRGDGTGGPGSPDATVADARSHGILWVNAAGNMAEDHWSGTFAPDSTQPQYTDFAPGDDTNEVTMQPGEDACVYLKWDDWPVTSEDFDLGLYDGDGNLVADSDNDQSDGPLPPTESLCYTNTAASAVDYYIAIDRYAAVGNPQFDLYYTGESPLEYSTAQGSLLEPASSPDALAVGAACWQTGALEPFSSQGPTISDVIKPELVGPDSVSTDTYGAAGAGCGSSGFVGTSAAAPQVAGAAADVLSEDPSLTVSGLEAQLEATSIAASPDALSVAWGSGPLALGSPSPPAVGSVVFVENGEIVALPDATPVESRTPVAIPVSGLPSGDSVVAATISPDGSKIAFVDADGGVWTVPASGGGATQIVPSSADAEAYGAPGWSPGGSKIAYGSAAGITIVDANGADPTVIAPVGYGPQWSPNGNELAVWGDASGEGFPGIVAAGAESVQPVNGEAPPASAWSPDGSSVLGGNTDGVYELNVTTQQETHIIDANTITWTFPEWIDGGGDILVDEDSGLGAALWRYDINGGPATAVLGQNEPYPSWAPTDVVGPESDVQPILSGTASVGETLEVSSGTWSPAQGTSFSFAWSRCTNSSSCTPIGGADDSVYEIQPDDVGFTLVATVTATFDGVSRQSASGPSATVEVAAPYATALPTLSGTSTLTMSSPGAWVGSPAFTEQWLRCDVYGANCTAIAGQTNTTYTPTAADNGNTIRISVTGTNAGGSAVSTSSAVAVGATLPGAPTNVTATAGNGSAVVSFDPPASNGGAPVTSYTAAASPGGAHATGAASPITISGLTNGTSYTFTVTATNSVGTGPASGSSNAVTPMAPTGGGGGGGGGGGSDAIAVSMTPSAQSVSNGGNATFTIVITNTGGGYLFNVGASDPAAPSCDQATASTPASTLATLETMAPGVTVTYSCTVAVSSSLANTVTVSGIGPDGVTVTASASGSVSVSGSAPAPFTPPATGSSNTSSGGSSKVASPAPTLSFASLTVTALKAILLGKRLTLHLTTKLSAATVLDLVLLDSKGHTLTRWVIHAKKGTDTLSLLLLANARKPGHDKLNVTETGNKKPKTFSLTIKA